MSEARPSLPETLSPPTDALKLSQGKEADGAGWADEAEWAAEAAQRDPVGWHYIQVLAERTRSQPGPAQALLQAKLSTAVTQLQARLAVPQNPNTLPSRSAASPLFTLLQDMAAPTPERPLNPSGQGRMDKPHIVAFRQQLGKISVQKQVTQAIAQAPQNAGPINSHMLVLRSLGLMRDLSPDYLNRFMGYVDTLLFLDAPQTVKATPKKAAPASKSER
ncbi:DUF2894 domain-containing protein [Limnohabitans sp.]|uniref:DUF2894 domain-containing protein n=1 Tax=Limnohabitans sp. TaxID=1907725 RepID=UPI0025C0FE04|nr:DUF2894 domain-containing protein [Limnohabitans sp.]